MCFITCVFRFVLLGKLFYLVRELKNEKVMKYVNKNTGDVISSNVYNQLSAQAMSNFIAIKESVIPSVIKTHQIIETKSDSMSIGDGIACAVILPIIAIWSMFD